MKIWRFMMMIVVASISFGSLKGKVVKENIMPYTAFRLQLPTIFTMQKEIYPYTLFAEDSVNSTSMVRIYRCKQWNRNCFMIINYHEIGSTEFIPHANDTAKINSAYYQKLVHLFYKDERYGYHLLSKPIATSVKVGKACAIRVSCVRTHRGGAPQILTCYFFNNYNECASVVISYPQSEAPLLGKSFKQIVRTFVWNNPNYAPDSKADLVPGQLDYHKLHIFLIIVGVIATVWLVYFVVGKIRKKDSD